MTGRRFDHARQAWIEDGALVPLEQTPEGNLGQTSSSLAAEVLAENRLPQSGDRFLVLERTPTLERVLDRALMLVEYVYTPDPPGCRDGGRFARGFLTLEAEHRHPEAREATLRRLARRLNRLTPDEAKSQAEAMLERQADPAEPWPDVDAGTLWRRYIYGID